MFSPLLGYSIDRFGLKFMLVATISMGSMYAFVLWLGSFFVGAVVFSLFSSSYFSYTFSCLAFEFGSEYYGLLAGIVQAIGSIALLLLQPCVRTAAARYSWSQVQLAQAVAFIIFGLLLICVRSLRSVLLRRRSSLQQNAPLVECEASGGTVPTDYRLRHQSYSEGDVHTTEGNVPCRRRPNLFPHTDDILVIDGAYSHHSRAAYQLEDSSKQALSPIVSRPSAETEPDGLQRPRADGIS